MLVKIIFAFVLLAVGIFFVTRKHLFFKVVGVAGLLLWLFIGDWGGFEIARKIFHFVRGNFVLSLKILAGIVVAIIVLGWLFSKFSLGKGTKHNSFATAAKKSQITETKLKGTVYVVDGKEFDNYTDAQMYAKQFHPDSPASWISVEKR